MSPTIVTSVAGPLCVSHLSTWQGRVDYDEAGGFIRLRAPVDEMGNQVFASVVVAWTARPQPLVQFLGEVVTALHSDQGVLELCTKIDPEGKEAEITYRIATKGKQGAEGEKLAALIIIKKYATGFTRFHFIAPPPYYVEHYKEARIMGTTVDYVE